MGKKINPPEGSQKASGQGEQTSRPGQPSFLVKVVEVNPL